MCPSITSSVPDDVSYIVYSKFNDQQIVDYKAVNQSSATKTTKAVYARRQRREDHSTDPTHPAFDGRIIGGTVANIKRIQLTILPRCKLYFRVPVFHRTVAR